MPFLLTIIASAGSSQQSSPGGMMGFMMPMLLIFMIMWLLIFRPQARKQKMHQKMIEETQSGDRIMTVGGVFGTVKGFKKENRIVILEIADGCKVDLLRSSIAQNISAEERVEAAKKK